jgi:hypothetical protein
VSAEVAVNAIFIIVVAPLAGSVLVVIIWAYVSVISFAHELIVDWLDWWRYRKSRGES